MPLQQLSDWIAETPESIAARLAAANTVQRHTQLTTGLMAIVSMTMLIASYNAYLSFDSQWVLDRARHPLQAHTTVADVLTARAVGDWAESRNVSIALLGIRVSVDDAPVLGTSTLLLISLWLLLLTRRENHTVGFLLRDTDTPSGEPEGPGSFAAEDSGRGDPWRRDSSGQRWLIFHTVVANNMFVTFDRSLRRVRSLRGATPLDPTTDARVRGAASRLALEFARNVFFWFPVVASGAVFYLDRRSYFQPDPFMPNAMIPGTSAPFFYGSTAVFLACWIPLLVSCWKSSQYSRATESVLHEYGEKLRADLVRQRPESERPR